MPYGSGRDRTEIKYAPLLDALTAHLKKLQWEEASGLRHAPVMPPHPSVHMPPSPTASQMYDMPAYQVQPQQHMFQPPAPAHWQAQPAGYPMYGGAAAAPDLADQEPFPYFMQARSSPSSDWRSCIVDVHHTHVLPSGVAAATTSTSKRTQWACQTFHCFVASIHILGYVQTVLND